MLDPSSNPSVALFTFTGSHLQWRKVREILMDVGDGLKNPCHRRRITETVLQILKESDFDTATEFSVRVAAAQKLGFQLSGSAQLQLVQQLIDSFLLSNATSILATTSPAKGNDDNNKTGLNGERCQKRQQQTRNGVVGLQGNSSGKVICKLSERRWVAIHDVNGTTMVAIRDFFAKDGKMRPSKVPNGGVNLTTTEWSSFRNSFSSIEEAIVKLESKLGKQAVHQLNNWSCGSEAVSKPSEADLTNSVADSAAEENQAREEISQLTDTVKRKRSESEAEITSSGTDSAPENSHIKAGISNSTIFVHPNITRRQTDANTSRSTNALNSQECILAERKHEEAGDSGADAALESRENTTAERKQSDAHPSLSLPTFQTQGQVHGTAHAAHPEKPDPAEIQEPEADILTAGPMFPSRGKLHPGRLTPIQTARFDGRNYHCWRHQMQFLLNQLNIAYVLTEPCPSTYADQEASFDERAKVRRWIDADYLCRHHILNSLCDGLFQLYSQKIQSAKELWEELNSTYNEDFGMRRSQISKYINFQMVDGVSILDQVHELHKIANSVIASGTSIDDDFHVSAIISKLPPSWKDFRIRLMHEEYLPFNVLLHHLQVEEGSRYWHKQEYENGHVTEARIDSRVGMRKGENKRVCFGCGKEGHIIKNCRNRKFDDRNRSQYDEHDAVMPTPAGNKNCEAASKTK